MSTPNTPRSRTPSRVGTPISALSRLAPPQLARPVPSAPSRVYSHGATSGLQTPVSDSPQPDAYGPREGASSSASSALTIETPIAEGMLVQEVDVEVDVVDGEQGTINGRMDARAGDEESKQHLREQLRRTLNRKESSNGGYPLTPSDTLDVLNSLTVHLELTQRNRRRKGKAVDMHEIAHSPGDYLALLTCKM